MMAFEKLLRLLHQSVFAALLVLVVASASTLALAGPKKTFSMTVGTNASFSIDPVTLQESVDVPVPMTVTIKNESPPSAANSNINSFSFTVTGVTISAVDTNACRASGGTCALDPTKPNTVNVTGISPPIQAQGMFTVPLRASSCGEGTWTAKVYSGSQLNGDVFGGTTSVATSVRCGKADCGKAFNVHSFGSVAGSPTSVTGLRGKFDKDGNTGETCSVVDYTVTNTIPTNDILHFDWQVAPAGAFRYTLNFSSPLPAQVAWSTDSAGPVFIDAQQCEATNEANNNNLPTPYGVLTSDVTMNATKLKVDTSAYAGTNPVLAVPFAIVVGTERMRVTNVTNGNWTVERRQGGTEAARHSGTSLVMSTPLPLIASTALSSDPTIRQRQTSAGYIAGNQARMCIANPPSTSWPSSTYDVIDIGDGYVKGGF
jgi:hypothetical protein